MTLLTLYTANMPSNAPVHFPITTFHASLRIYNDISRPENSEHCFGHQYANKFRPMEIKEIFTIMTMLTSNMQITENTRC